MSAAIITPWLYVLSTTLTASAVRENNRGDIQYYIRQPTTVFIGQPPQEWDSDKTNYGTYH